LRREVVPLRQGKNSGDGTVEGTKRGMAPGTGPHPDLC
jgi:hypothetical protein